LEYRGQIVVRKEAEEREQIFTTSRKLYVFLPMGRKNLLVSFFYLQHYKTASGTFVPAKKGT